MAKDPVCGMEINEGQARHRTLHRGGNYFFCSEDCKVKFESNPEKYSDTVENEVSKTRKVVVLGAGQVGATICFFKDIIPKITAHEPKTLLIVSNPVDILTYVALKVSNYPMNRVIGSGTVLDTARFRFLLSRHYRVDPHNVHAYIIGEHGDSEVPVWSQANIAGVPLEEYYPASEKNDPAKEREEIFGKVNHVEDHPEMVKKYRIR